jgi:hypothetical protein
MSGYFRAIMTAAAVAGIIGVFLVAASVIEAQRSTYTAPRTPDGKPNLNGLWQAMNTANWDFEPHPAQAGPPQFGALFSIPGGLGVVEGGTIPYKPDALAKKKENLTKRWTEDPEAKCYFPGVPRFVYLPFPFQIVQSSRYMVMTSEYASAVRNINFGPPQEPPVNTWMGQSNGRWEGESLVVDVKGLNGQAWFDRAGNFASENVRITERFTPASADRLTYEAEIEDPTVFTRPWKISMPLYRRAERDAQLLEFKCIDFAEDLLYGQFYKKRPTE